MEVQVERGGHRREREQNQGPGKTRTHRLILRKVRRAIELSRVFEGVRRVVVGLSGGPDSSVLLHLLADLRREGGPEVVAVHVHHGIRGKEAERDARSAEILARAHGVAFHCVRVRPPKGALSAEHALRDLRLRALESAAKKAGAQRIALGHHRDDQAETFLLRLLTGTDVRGLSAMRMFRPPLWVRPLLGVSRAEILGEAKGCGLLYVLDTTNERTRARRNFLRHNVLPLLASEFNPRISEHLSKLAESFASVSGLLEKEAGKLLKKSRLGPGRYRVEPFRKAHEAIRAFALTEAYRETAGKEAALRRPQVEQVISLVLSDGKERRLALPRRVYLERAKNWFRFGQKG